MALLPTLAEWLDAHGVPAAPDLSEYDRVTVAWLQYHQAVAQRVDEMRADPIAAENVRALFDVLSSSTAILDMGGSRSMST